jgi:flagellar biosynthesis/type III secretory pathway protein FliH
MPYISTAERFGIKKGLQQGLQQGLLQGMQEGVQKGLQKGLQQGLHPGTLISLKKGRLEGETVLLLKLLQRKFGILNPMVQKRIDNADAEILLQWGERLLMRKRLKEFFKIKSVYL